MTYEYDKEYFVKNCLKCGRSTSDRKEGDNYCPNCGSRLRNVCLNTSSNSFKNGYHEQEVILKPSHCYCSKCGEPSAFQSEGLIDCEYQVKKPKDVLPF